MRVLGVPSAAMNSGASSSSDTRAKRLKADRRLVAISSAPKSAIASILAQLHADGELADGSLRGSSTESVRKHLGRSVAALADTPTPYGPLVQNMVLPTSPPFSWPDIHPMALVFYLSSISSSFTRVLSECATSQGLRIVLYIDEYRPGNILRPDKGRATQNIFWVFTGWPQWLLSRVDAWMLFGCLRSSVLASLPGGTSNLMRRVLKVFFSPSGGPNIETGLVLHPSTFMQATFAGFLGDEKGLKDMSFVCAHKQLQFGCPGFLNIRGLCIAFPAPGLAGCHPARNL